ncbi:DUF4041 domain-containing protein [Telluribacter humicola]|uniref:DUF4041 domain-containing protein n=1 Tax=Telluribacter humicola TaxID=1720261 RepID=UPI001A963E27|nr:DUF4041 domain-containing protein [Telluribacter humicola]
MQLGLPIILTVTLLLAALFLALYFLFITNKKKEELIAKYSNIISVNEEVARLQQSATEIRQSCETLSTKYKQALITYNEIEDLIAINKETTDLYDYGLYEPRFDFETSQEYKDRILENHKKQKMAITSDTAAVCIGQWSINGDTSEGTKLVNKYKKLMMFAFNGECDSLIAKVKWHNFAQTELKIQNAFFTINRLGRVQNTSIQDSYLELKYEELALYYEYERKKYEEKEEQRRVREQMREEEKARMEYEKAKREAAEEERRYQKALEKAMSDLGKADQKDLDELNEKIALLEQNLKNAHDKKERAISMAQLTRAGHIYVISNIGSFGEGVYKIGMTRRLEPMDRVRELGDASVPFRFDVHAIIFSEDAPQLEYNIHKAFAGRRVNMTNHRREFFKVGLDEIEEYIKTNYKDDVEFIPLAEAKEYRETLSLMNRVTVEKSSDEPVFAFPEDLFDEDLI